MRKYSNGNYYQCRIHKFKIRRSEVENSVVECVKSMALAALQELELKKEHSVCKDILSDEAVLLEKSLQKVRQAEIFHI